jgi:hypothetical protein
MTRLWPRVTKRPVDQHPLPPEQAPGQLLEERIDFAVDLLRHAVESYANAQDSPQSFPARGALYGRNLVLHRFEQAMVGVHARTDGFDLDQTEAARRLDLLLGLTASRSVPHLMDAVVDVALERGEDPEAAVDQTARLIKFAVDQAGGDALFGVDA